MICDLEKVQSRIVCTYESLVAPETLLRLKVRRRDYYDEVSPSPLVSVDVKVVMGVLDDDDDQVRDGKLLREGSGLGSRVSPPLQLVFTLLDENLRAGFLGSGLGPNNRPKIKGWVGRVLGRKYTL